MFCFVKIFSFLLYSSPCQNNSGDINEGPLCIVPAAIQKTLNILHLSLKVHKYGVKVTLVKMSACWSKTNLFPGKTGFFGTENSCLSSPVE